MKSRYRLWIRIARNRRWIVANIQHHLARTTHVRWDKLFKPGDTVDAHRNDPQLITLQRDLRNKLPHYKHSHDKIYLELLRAIQLGGASPCRLFIRPGPFRPAFAEQYFDSNWMVWCVICFKKDGILLSWCPKNAPEMGTNYRYSGKVFRINYVFAVYENMFFFLIKNTADWSVYTWYMYKIWHIWQPRFVHN